MALTVHECVFTAEDMANVAYRDAGELKRCPFCGGKPMSGGDINPNSGNLVYRVFCQKDGCHATVSVCLGKPEETKIEARAQAVSRWNRRFV
jgi:Lar family restriction alleviation protein